MKKREAEAREKIIEAATALIAEHGGAENVTTRDIAARSGVGVGLVNYHFQTKENLINLCVQRIIGDVISGFDALYKGLELEPIEKLRFLVKSTARFLARNPGISRTSITADMLAPAREDNTSQTLEAYFPVIREVCQGRATETEMRVLLHLLVSALQAAFLRGDSFRGFAGLDFSNDTQRDQLVDVIIYILFRKYV